MTTEDTQRLGRLLQIAEMKADRALQDLADANSERERVTYEIKVINDQVRSALENAQDPVSQNHALRYAEMKREHRRELIAELARAELQRKVALKAAQQEEGRRIALEKLRSQAS